MSGQKYDKQPGLPEAESKCSNRLKLCQILQQGHKISWIGITNDSQWSRKSKFCWAQFLTVPVTRSTISLHFLAHLAVCCWSWSSTSQPLFNPCSSSFHDRNSERCAGLFLWFQRWRFSLYQLVTLLSLVNLLLWFSYFWLNKVQQKKKSAPFWGEKHIHVWRSFSSFWTFSFEWKFGQQSSTSILRKISPLFWSWLLPLFPMKSQKESEIHSSHMCISYKSAWSIRVTNHSKHFITCVRIGNELTYSILLQVISVSSENCNTSHSRFNYFTSLCLSVNTSSLNYGKVDSFLWF